MSTVTLSLTLSDEEAEELFGKIRHVLYKEFAELGKLGCREATYQQEQRYEYLKTLLNE